MWSVIYHKFLHKESSLKMLWRHLFANRQNRHKTPTAASMQALYWRHHIYNFQHDCDINGITNHFLDTRWSGRSKKSYECWEWHSNIFSFFKFYIIHIMHFLSFHIVNQQNTLINIKECLPVVRVELIYVESSQ